MRFVLVFFLSVISSCHNKRDIANTKINFTFYPAFPDTSEDKGFLLNERSYNNQLFNLPDLFKGSADSLEIRIWQWEALFSIKDVIVLKNKGNEWKGFHYNSYTMPLKGYDGNIYTLRHLNQKEIGDSVFIVKDMTPACGWQKFSDSIEYFKIKSLPTKDSIHNYQEQAIRDGSGVDIEYATPFSYRLISYHNPTVQYEECRLIIGFMEMLRRQLGNGYLWPRGWLYSKK